MSHSAAPDPLTNPLTRKINNGFVSVPIDDLPICAAKAADWAELYAGYTASPSD